MFDLGTSFLASTERDPSACAIIDGDLRLTYAQWLERIKAVMGLLEQEGVAAGDHLVTALQNRWEAATLHWACQLAGIVITPVNWRCTVAELKYAIEDSGARVCIVQDVSREAGQGVAAQLKIRLIDIDADGQDFQALPVPARAVTPKASDGDISLMLYTSGTTGKPKGVPRTHRAERAAGIAHVAQNTYRQGERTLGVMPLYHTMGVRSLIAMSLVGGCFVCLPRFEVQEALKLIARERITCLYLVPTLYHAMLYDPAFKGTDISSVRYLGFAGASMTNGLLLALQDAFKPRLFVNHFGSSEVYTVTIHQNAPSKPGSAGRAGLNQRIRIVDLAARDPEQVLPAGTEGEIIASLNGDEAFGGYWNRPDANEKALRGGWYFTGDTGYIDADGDLFVTGRADDMIITGGENVSPVEVENVISMMAGVQDVAVAGLPDERWGQIVAAFIVPGSDVSVDAVDAYCRTSDLANYKRPRRIVMVRELPKSPVGKLLRHKLIAGHYETLEPSAS